MPGMLFALTSAVLLVLAARCAAQGGFTFQDSVEELPGQRHPQNKVPLLAPNQCATNELLYPADLNDEWVCDCKQGFLYHPATSQCYEPHRQGPCPPNFTLTLPVGTYVPQCQRNACAEGDGFVRFRGRCHQLGTSGPCELPELSYVVTLNVTTLQPDCQLLSDAPNLHSRFDDDDVPVVATEKPLPEVLNRCPVGSQRWLERKCE